jgi:hypothetical protein
MDGTEKKAQAKDEETLKEDDRRQEEIRPLGEIPVDHQDGEYKDKGNEKVQKGRENNGKGQDLSGEIDRFYQITAV